MGKHPLFAGLFWLQISDRYFFIGKGQIWKCSQQPRKSGPFISTPVHSCFSSTIGTMMLFSLVIIYFCCSFDIVWHCRLTADENKHRISMMSNRPTDWPKSQYAICLKEKDNRHESDRRTNCGYFIYSFLLCRLFARWPRPPFCDKTLLKT